MAEHLVNLAAFLLILSAVWMLLTYKKGFVKSNLIVNWICVIPLFAALAIRWKFYISAMGLNPLQSFPVASFYESVVLLACIVLVIVNLTFKAFNANGPLISCLTNGICGIILLALNFSNIPSKPVLFLPSLKSYWLTAHVLLSFIAYAMFFVATILSIYSLCSKSGLSMRSTIESLIGKGLIIFTIGGLVFGAVWAEHSWGRLWAWDPKETWAFITWCVYALLFHLTYSSRISEKVFYLLTAIAFLFVIFTFVGVNVIFAGLHSYVNI